MDYKTLLNEEQYKAVICPNGPVLVSAGAGSGKTRLLTYRIAYLITECNVPAHKILAITFTNKAAGEMKERILKVAEDGDKVTVSTFHSFCAKMLRSYSSMLDGYKENFTIFSDSDTAKILKDLFKKYNLEDEGQKGKYKHFLSKLKNDNQSIQEFVKANSYTRDIDEFANFYADYQDMLRKNNAMDFDDLLINFYKLITTKQEVLDSIQNRYTYFSVDEFQDTNTLQYDIVKILASKSRNILIVGDEDQSIYGWRGANFDNIFNFTKDFPDAKVFKLQQNYRSTKSILDKANLIIKNNKNRLDKILFTENENGNEVTYYEAFNEHDEADFVVRNIMRLRDNGVPLHEMAILMRLNSLSRVFEEKLLAYNIPHVMYNGFKFYERAEIKSVLSYLTAIINPDDDISFSRIINFPKRGIGETSINKLLEIAVRRKCSLKHLVMNHENEDLPKTLKEKLGALKLLFNNLEGKISQLGIYEFFNYMLEETKILESFDIDNDQEYERYLNVNSLSNSVREFEKNNADATIEAYLESVTLSSAMDNDDGSGVVIATVHGAKGLEFNTVFVIGCEEKIFPISRDDIEDLEEERRLMYVALTRAKQQLFLTSSSQRFLYGKNEYTIKSRFLYELELAKKRKINNSISTYNSYQNNVNNGGNMNTLQSNNTQSFNYTFSKDTVTKKTVDFSKIKLGAEVVHPKFGEGKITEISPNSSNHCVKIKFDGVGEKMLSLDYAPIEFKD